MSFIPVPAGTRILCWPGPPPLVKAPSHLPDPDKLLKFDVDKKKHEIFEAARERIKSKAQYTKSGRKPWTQITIALPIKPATTGDDDLAVVWAVMSESTNNEVKETATGDMVWTMWGSHQYLQWLNIDPEKTKPVNKFIHPVMYETGARKETLISNKLKKAQKNGNSYEIESLERQLEEYLSAQAAKEATTTQSSGKDYHWSNYTECVVTYKKKQTRKVVNELQLTVKIRTAHLGCGDPRENNGYLGSADSSDVVDPESKMYQILKSIGM